MSNTERYDSIRGKKMYIVHSNAKAYPTYLIEY